jgi:hypothetical protein
VILEYLIGFNTVYKPPVRGRTFATLVESIAKTFPEVCSLAFLFLVFFVCVACYRCVCVKIIVVSIIDAGALHIAASQRLSGGAARVRAALPQRRSDAAHAGAVGQQRRVGIDGSWLHARDLY